jgi:hypothetical protein
VHPAKDGSRGNVELICDIGKYEPALRLGDGLGRLSIHGVLVTAPRSHSTIAIVKHERLAGERQLLLCRCPLEASARGGQVGGVELDLDA